MKKFLSSLTGLLMLLFMFSCGKDDISNEDIQKKKIADIIPQQYIDSLRKIGLDINIGTKPPEVEGVYAISPYILDTSNFNDVAKPGYRFNNGVLKLYDQSNSDYGINLIGRNFLKDRDTSIATAISGDGDKFTVYGKVKAANNYNDGYVIAAIVISGTLENADIKNFKIGIICIDDSHSDGTFLTAGQGRLAYDSDKMSERVTDDAVSFRQNDFKNNIKNIKSILSGK